MSGGPATGVVVDTMVINWLLNDRPEDLAGRYRDLIGANPVRLAFQTLMELRYGALRAGWGHGTRVEEVHRDHHTALGRIPWHPLAPVRAGAG